MENDAKFYSDDEYTIALMRELEVAQDKIKELEIDNANLRREELTGKTLLMEGC